MLRGYLELLRPPNVVTAIADVLAGYAVAGRANAVALPWLIGSTVCLYAGGVVLNDYFDRHLDAAERPERPIPSGRVPAAAAATLGSALLGAGVLCATQATRTAFGVAAAIAVAVVLYDARAKRHSLAGPLTMGLCRGLNLLLGVSAVPAALSGRWPIAVLSVVYIAAVTAVSRGEVHGGRSRTATLALVSLCAVMTALAALAIRTASGRIAAFVVIGALAYRVLPPFWRPVKDPRPMTIRHAVRAGVLSLVLVDAAIGAAYAGPAYAAVVLGIGLVATSLASLFSVT